MHLMISFIIHLFFFFFVALRMLTGVQESPLWHLAVIIVLLEDDRRYHLSLTDDMPLFFFFFFFATHLRRAFICNNRACSLLAC